MSASSSAAKVTGSVVVVTRVRQNVYRVLPPLSGTASFNPAENYRGRLVLYAAVQTFIGVTIFMLAGLTVTQSNSVQLSFSTGAFVWGPWMSMTAGILMGVTGRLTSRSLVMSTVRFNVAATVTSTAATMIFFLDASGLLISSDPPFENVAFITMLSGVAGVLSFLEFGLSMFVALHCCDSCNPAGQPLTVTNQLFGTDPVSVETPPTNQTPPTATAPSTATAPRPPDENPLEYSSITN
ncbi:uncharacterized protein LOC141779481 [Sebastes fasciatus]|uniref:uncharacterized protein LOC141779481 n=1 Tax=Sebastes fasciatus TaxID=394691 RepID=UPI003D9DF6D3